MHSLFSSNLYKNTHTHTKHLPLAVTRAAVTNKIDGKDVDKKG